jgi:hypothetical protein
MNDSKTPSTITIQQNGQSYTHTHTHTQSLMLLIFIVIHKSFFSFSLYEERLKKAFELDDIIKTKEREQRG